MSELVPIAMAFETNLLHCNNLKEDNNLPIG